MEKLIRAGLRNPVRVTIKEKPSSESVASQRTPAALHNMYMLVKAEDKLEQLVAFITAHRKHKIMLFLSTCAAVDYFSRILPHLVTVSQVQALSLSSQC